MDRIIPIEVKKKYRRKLFAKIVISLAIAFIVFYYAIIIFSHKLDYRALKTSIVDNGLIDVSVYAIGKIVPVDEIVITAPISSKILEVYKKIGDKVNKGDSILKLDIKSFKTDYESKREEHQLKASNLRLKKMTLENKMKDLEMQLEIAEMQYKRAQVMFANEKFLDSIGASTSDKVRQMELENRIKKMQLDQLYRNLENERLASVEELKSLELNYKISQRNIELMQKTLGEAQILSPKTATLSWINDQIGASISIGGELAKISDLSKFKIEGEISDTYASKVSNGNNALIKIGKEKIYGTVSNITPSSKDGIIKFFVFFNDTNHMQLRSGLKVDLYITHSVRDNVLRIDNASFYTNARDYDLWVIHDNKAIKRKVKLGECSVDKVEVISGLEEGEEVIISDMNAFHSETMLKISR